MSEAIFFESLLDIPGLKIDSVSHEGRKIILSCHMEGSDSVCPSCGSSSTHQLKRYSHRKIRDLDISGKEVWLEVRVRQWSCECGHHYHERLEWADAGKSYSKRQAKFIFLCCARQPFTEVGAIHNMCPKTVERLYYAKAEEMIELPSRYAQVRKLGIDELAHRKGKGDFCCVLTDLERGIQLDILKDRKKATLIAHFQELGPEFCAQITDVSCDMWGPYVDVARQCFPQARITIDRFHVVKALNEVLDRIRKRLRKEQPKEEGFKRLKWLLFKRSDQLTEAEKQTLRQALLASPRLRKAYQLRNAFHAIFDQEISCEQAQQQLQQWIERTHASEEPQWEKFLNTLKRWKEEIVNFVESGISNAVTEGLNNLIRYIKRISFAIPNFEHMRLRVLAASP